MLWGLGEACWSPVVSPAPENNQQKKEMRKRQEKWRKGGLALVAAELRRDALIAPSGCGQYRGDEGEEEEEEEG